MVFFGLAPIMVAQTAPTPVELGPLAYAGAALSLLGVTLQGIADLQLARFKADPANAGKVLDTGLWRYSRHPNYFGETCVWWGFWLIACEHPWGWFTVFSPAFFTWSIMGMMGKELVERRMLKKRPGLPGLCRAHQRLLPLAAAPPAGGLTASARGAPGLLSASRACAGSSGRGARVARPSACRRGSALPAARSASPQLPQTILPRSR